ncbi:NUDIX hydrolase [Micromonospora sp. NBC_01813]|uniref:NUDIX hydrolase n=1 Tax=Micromonospora sp. NBC_01813 TaxID=2975988 RepID=UPI002DD80AA3|nr:NUDIX hydrolase [Micromonospora sp. NBC_01813]WSA11059.1 NUDIX hydrolase [Micromonospora sp. NBC_01813]
MAGITGSSRHSVSVAAVVVDDTGHVLVTQRRDNGHWEPPGGVLELDESVLDGVRREVREETGLLVEPLRLTGVYKNMPRGIIALVFRARPTGGATATSAETRKVEWWEPAVVAERMDPAYAVRVLDALRDDGPAVRAHDGVSVLRDIAALPE